MVVCVNKSLERRLYSDDGRYLGQPGLCRKEEEVSADFSDGISLLLETISLALRGNGNVLSEEKSSKYFKRKRRDTLRFDLNNTFFSILSSCDTQTERR